MNKKYGERSGIYNLTSRKLPMLPREYGKLHAVLHVEEQLWQMHHTLLAQYWVNKGLRLYKEECAESVLKGLRQLHQKLAIYPNEPTKMMREEKQYAPRYLMFLKKKRCRCIKGRRCANFQK